MESITTTDELKNAIQILEFEQQIREQQIKEQVFLTIESLKPANLIRSTIHEIISSPHLVENTLSTVVGLISGYFSKKIAIGKSGNFIRNLLGTILQFGVTNVVARNMLKNKNRNNEHI